MPLFPIDCLTDIDKQTINEYLKVNNFNLINLENVLNNWNKNKLTLFKALGKQLKISVPIETKVRNKYLIQKLKDYYSYPASIHYDFDTFVPSDILFMMRQNPSQVINDYHLTNEFIKDSFLFFLNSDSIPAPSYFTFLRLLDYQDVFNNYYNNTFDEPLKFAQEGKKDLIIKSGTKIMRAIRKVLEYYNYPNMKLFEKWRDDISIIRTTTHTTSNLVISIHPIDFMTLSDNNSNWSSCLNWKREGCYSNGTIELLNSNMAVVCYIENPNTEYFINPESSQYIAPNKMWRAIGYVHKKIILIGKSYPFSDDDMSQRCLKILEDLVYKNLKWKYSFHNQEYKDSVYFENDNDLHHGSMEEIKYMIDSYDKACFGNHIFLGSNNLYNDVVADPLNKYYCSRNKVNGNLFLNVSGKCSCLICGEEIDVHGSSKVCPTCQSLYMCGNCRKVDNHYKKMYSLFITTSHRSYLSYAEYAFEHERNTINLCDKCLKDMINKKYLSVFKSGEDVFLAFNKEFQDARKSPLIYYVHREKPYDLNLDIEFTYFQYWYIEHFLFKNYFYNIDKNKLLEMKKVLDNNTELLTFDNIKKYPQLIWAK